MRPSQLKWSHWVVRTPSWSLMQKLLDEPNKRTKMDLWVNSCQLSVESFRLFLLFKYWKWPEKSPENKFSAWWNSSLIKFSRWVNPSMWRHAYCYGIIVHENMFKTPGSVWNAENEFMNKTFFMLLPVVFCFIFVCTCLFVPSIWQPGGSAPQFKCLTFKWIVGKWGTCAMPNKQTAGDIVKDTLPPATVHWPLESMLLNPLHTSSREAFVFYFYHKDTY